jgi:membrane protease YdiL (CAAX protease family)
MWPGRLRFLHDIVIFDPLLFILTALLGMVPLSLISVLSQNNAITMGKSNTIMIMGIGGLVMAILLSQLKQQKFKWINFNDPLFRIMGLVVLVMLGATYMSQWLISSVASLHVFGIVDVLQAKLFYGGVGIFEELFFGLFLFLTLNNLIDNKYWTMFNFILNPLLFAIYHIYVLGTSISLFYVLAPRIIWNLIYLIFAVPSIIMVTHWAWNFLLASLSVTAMSIMTFSSLHLIMLAFSSLAGPLMLTFNCLPIVGLLVYQVVRSR